MTLGTETENNLLELFLLLAENRICSYCNSKDTQSIPTGVWLDGDIKSTCLCGEIAWRCKQPIYVLFEAVVYSAFVAFLESRICAC